MSEPKADNFEMTKLCAEAMGIALKTRDGARNTTCGEHDLLETLQCVAYDPLNDDKQAMALIKRFRPIIDRDEIDFYVTLRPEWQGQDVSLNRAVVEAVAEMQRGKDGQ